MREKPELWKNFSPFFAFAGFSQMAIYSIIVNFVPISYIIWPEEPYHAFEIGILLAAYFWAISIAGIVFGRLVDKYSRKKIYLTCQSLRGILLLLLASIPMGQGISSFLIVFLIGIGLGASGGLLGPAIHSFSNDVLERDQRSQFFGVLGTIDMISSLAGPLLSSFLIQFGYWSIYFLMSSIIILILVIYGAFSLQEPKRAAKTEGIKDIIQVSDITYEYQINMKTLRSTMLSKTNLAALIEGLFTCLFYKMTESLILPYVQTPPHNVSPFNTMLILIGFGFPGALLSQLLLAKKSDALGKRNPIIRIKFIVFSLFAGFLLVFVYFFLPFPNLTPEQGYDTSILIYYPIIWVVGILIFGQRAIQGIYNINQPPIIQDINLPEAQGQIRAWNQFLETIGNGLGPLLGGLLLYNLSNNYQLAAIISILIGIPGVILWISALKFYQKDKDRIREIIDKRADQMKRDISQNK
ncbi:MAG: MFS transporter, partial [Candidatus Lokiarchaeota archaeon]|nr:MFS transporter [Candidatus Lokiarchaeota archaeon]